MTITNCRVGLAVLTGDIVDQAALHGILNKTRNLNLPLISLTFRAGRERTREESAADAPGLMQRGSPSTSCHPEGRRERRSGTGRTTRWPASPQPAASYPRASGQFLNLPEENGLSQNSHRPDHRLDVGQWLSASSPREPGL